MAELNGSGLYEVEMELLMETMPYRILVPAMAALVFAVGYIVGGDIVSEVPVMMRHAGFLAVLFSFLCCIAMICIYMVVRFQLKPPPTRNLFSVWTLCSAMAALTLVIWMYGVLTQSSSSYTRLWISVTVVGVVCFPILAYVVFAMALKLALRIAIAEVIASGIASAIDSAIAGLISLAISHSITQQPDTNNSN